MSLYELVILLNSMTKLKDEEVEILSWMVSYGKIKNKYLSKENEDKSLIQIYVLKFELTSLAWALFEQLTVCTDILLF